MTQVTLHGCQDFHSFREETRLGSIIIKNCTSSYAEIDYDDAIFITDLRCVHCGQVRKLLERRE